MRLRNKHNPILFVAMFSLFIVLLIVSCSPRRENQAQVKEIDPEILNLLSQSTGHTVLSQQSVVRFGDSTQGDSVQMKGYIIPDERRTNRVAIRFSGRIEKLYVRFPYQFVLKGEKLLEIYSPELTTAIDEYLFLYKSDSASALTSMARQKLTLLGLTNAQISGFVKMNEAPLTIAIYSPHTGYVIPSEQTVMSQGPMQQSSSGMSGMGQMNSVKERIVPSLNIREGSYVTTGQTLFAINDAREVIALLSVDVSRQGALKNGLPVSITSEIYPEERTNSSIDLIEPVLQSGQRFLSVRVLLANTNGKFMFNSLVTGRMISSKTGMRAVPSSCVFDLGTRKIVWVKSRVVDSVNVFVPHVVITGYSDGKLTEIISGLNPGEEIALEAGLLVDREGIINTELQ